MINGQLSVRPSKIVAGHEPEKTNEFLQAIGMAILSKVSLFTTSLYSTNYTNFMNFFSWPFFDHFKSFFSFAPCKVEYLKICENSLIVKSWKTKN